MPRSKRPSPAAHAGDESPSKVRLQRVLADAGIAARRVCEQMITEGRVIVNGHKMTKLPIFVDPANDRITVDGKPIPAPQQVICGFPHWSNCGGEASRLPAGFFVSQDA